MSRLNRWVAGTMCGAMIMGFFGGGCIQFLGLTEADLYGKDGAITEFASAGAGAAVQPFVDIFHAAVRSGVSNGVDRTLPDSPELRD